MAMLLANSRAVLHGSRKFTAQAASRSSSAARPTPRFTVRAATQDREQATDDNPAENAAREFEKNIVEPIVQKTKENSGLDAEVFNKTAKSAQNDEVGAFADEMSFAGLVPEIVNGRGAMVGMLTAFIAELTTRQPVLVQIQKAPVLILGTFGLIILASVIPVIRNADLNRKGAGPFTPRAEVWNGRLAMVSFATLLLVETWKAGPGLVP
jgi:hypothetical protein